MEIYTLDETFQRVGMVEDFVSALWTERYTKNGDMQIVVPDSSENRTKLSEGVRLALHGSDEVMLIESMSAEKGLVTVLGRTMETFFNERYFRNSAGFDVVEWTVSDTPGAILAALVQTVVIDATTLGLTALGGVANIIPGVALGVIDITDPVSSRKVPFGPLYDVMLPIAETAKLGMKLTLVSADAFGFVLGFTVYRGLDRTSDQLERDMVRFSPAHDTMTNIKELRSIAGFKNVAYVYPPDWSPATAVRTAYAPGYDATVSGFDRRILVGQASQITAEQTTGSVTLVQLMDQAAVDFLANNNYVKLVDGELVPQLDLRYGVDYSLGDIIELAADNVTIQKAMITEYIRSQDVNGERAYPTVSVVS